MSYDPKTIAELNQWAAIQHFRSASHKQLTRKKTPMAQPLNDSGEKKTTIYKLLNGFEHYIVRLYGHCAYPLTEDVIRIWLADNDRHAIQIAANIEEENDKVRYLTKTTIRSSFLDLHNKVITGHKSGLRTEFRIGKAMYEPFTHAIDFIEVVQALPPNIDECVYCERAILGKEMNPVWPFCSGECAALVHSCGPLGMMGMLGAMGMSGIDDWD